jgi:hypothetical protein
MALVDDYRQTLASYLRQRERMTTFAGVQSLAPDVDVIVREATRRLDELDARREALRSTPANPPATPAAPASKPR